MALFKLVGSKKMHSLRFPSLSLLSTYMKLLIQGVASCTGTGTPACSILFISCWNRSFRCMGIGSTGCLFGRYAWIKLDVVIWSQELANPLNDTWVLLHDHLLACYELGAFFLDCWHLSGHILLFSLGGHWFLLSM